MDIEFLLLENLGDKIAIPSVGIIYEKLVHTSIVTKVCIDTKRHSIFRSASWFLSSRIIDVPNEYRVIVDISDDIDKWLVEIDIKRSIRLHRSGFATGHARHRDASDD